MTIAKMMKPEVEAIRFGEVDVIATSGAGPVNFGTFYAAKGSEIQQSGDTAPQFYGETLNKIVFEHESDILTAYVFGDSPDDSLPYAWYKGNGVGWYTEGKSVSSYDTLPTD